MIIQSKKVWIADQFVPAMIEMEEGKIVSIAPYGTRPVDVDYGDKRIVPGFIDIHCHGAYTFDTNDAHEAGLRNWSKNVVDEGVTAFLATTITQSEEVLTNALMNVAKGLGVSIFIVGHVTKEGVVAGPRMLEHMVDTVLYFEGEKQVSYRILRGVKNRFGSTNEIGVFEMRQEGLVEVHNPSEFMLD